RYEEVAVAARDEWDRFPGPESVLMKANVLDRPLVDEYTRILKKAIELCWPGTKFKEHKFKIVPTHDVDWPYEYLFMPAKRIAKRALGRLLARGDAAGACKAALTWRAVRRGNDVADPFYVSILRLMSLS